jgi:hypothetical protein
MAAPRLIKQLGKPTAPGADLARERDLIEQINRCLTERDQQIAALLAEPVCFAFGCGTTDGLGGITPLYTYGCTLEVQGTQVVARFREERANDEYVYSALFVGDLSRVPVAVNLTVKTTEFCGVRFKTDAGTTWSASTNVFSTLIWAIGPRT